MDENFFNIQLLLEVIRTDLIGIASSIVGLGRAIGAIGALLYTAMLAYNAMLTGASLFTMKTFKPFAFGLLLMMYPAFMTVLDGLAMAVNNGIGGAMITDENRITEVLKTRDLRPDTDTDENLLGSREIEQEESEDVRDLVNRFTDAVSGSLNAFQWIGQKIYSGFMEVFETILFTFARAILVLINTLRVFFLVVLYIAGPLIIGLSIFPGFEGSFAAWIGRYLSVHLWLGIGHIFEAIAMRFWRLLADEEGFWTQALGLEGRFLYPYFLVLGIYDRYHFWLCHYSDGIRLDYYRFRCGELGKCSSGGCFL